MPILSVRTQSLGYLLIGVIAGAGLVFARSVVVDRIATSPSPSVAVVAPAVAVEARPESTPDDKEGKYHVTFKDRNHAYIQGSALLVENGTYLITDNSQGMVETVAVYPMDSVESIVAVSSETP